MALPAEDGFPEGDAPLRDWIRFVSLALPIRRVAHQFVVLVPVGAGDAPAASSSRLALVERVVGLEKPAHTRFEVRPYWAAFQVGGARVGFDTLLDRGSRFTALVLGSGHLGGGYLTAAYPMGVTDRFIAGRDAPGDGRRI